MYDLLKYIHILAAIVWVGGAFIIQMLAIQASRSKDPTDLPRLGRDVGIVGGRVFPIASVILLVAGAYLVTQRWSFGQAWVTISLVLWLASLLSGALYLGPRSTKVGELFAAEGPTSVAGRALMAQIFLISRLELVSFAVIVFLMVFKPGSV
jgi:uncharacterized membrane protein